MPELIRFIIRHTLIGFALAAVFVAGLFALNIGNLWYLVTHSPDGLLATFLLFFFNGIVFSGAQVSIAVLCMAEREEDGGPRGNAPQLSTVPVPVAERG